MTPLEINGCQVAFGADGFARLETFLCENREEFSRIVVLCDNNTHEHCLPMLAENVPSLTDYEIVEIPAGESYKNLDTCRQIWEALCDLKADRHTLQMRVWERGSGETLACGTGACAVAVASTLNGLVDEDKPVTVKLLGGDLQILWNRQENLVYMTGPATTVFDGEIFL